MQSFTGRVAAITGAASGIGRELAVNLAHRGAHLSLSDIDEAGLAETVQLCQRTGARAIGRIVDVADREAVHAWADETVAEFGRVNLIVNNAGVALATTVEAAEWKDLDWIIGINLWGVIHGTKAFLPHLIASGDGHIVNVSSVFGLMAVPTQSAYNAAKFGVRGFTDALRMELEASGHPVSATTVHPGGIKTNIVRNARTNDSAGAVAQDKEKAHRDFQAQSRTTPEQAAQVIVEAVLADRPRVTIGADAKLIDVVSRLPQPVSRAVMAFTSRRQVVGT